MKIISFVTHTPHQYDLANALSDCDMAIIGNNWQTQQRPVPPNVRFIDSFDPNDFDLAIGHVGGETEALIPQGFEQLPLILISHGQGEPYMTDNHSPHDPYAIAVSCGKYRVVCCNEREMMYWQHRGMQNATWIWHGMQEEFGQCNYQNKRALIVNSGGWDYMNNVPLLTELREKGINWLQKDRFVTDFDLYRKILADYNIYISGTRYSSFPRSRAEAMHTGMCVLTTNNWDEDKFIEDGVNGFFINDNVDEIMALVNSLDLATIERVGKAGQQAARKYFSREAYRKRWLEEINYVINQS